MQHGPEWRDGQAEIQRASGLIRQQLPEIAEDLIPLLDPGKASWVVTRFESGFRGLALDFSQNMDDWDVGEEGSSSCSIEGADLIADQTGTKVSLDPPVDQRKGQVELSGSPDWPKKPCVELNKQSSWVSFFNVPLDLEGQLVEILCFYVEWAQLRPDPAPDAELRKRVVLGDGAELAPYISRIRNAFRTAAKALPNDLRESAQSLLKGLLPERKYNAGYRIPRPELFKFI